MRVALLVAATGLAACDAASSELGLEAMLQVEGAQFVPGPFPASEGGPAGVQVTVQPRAIVQIGRTNSSVRGVIEPEARSALLGVEGYDGAWLIPAGPPDLDTPNLASASADIALADAFPPGPFTLLLAGVDERGVGETTSMLAMAELEPPTEGLLVVVLEWPGAADLDLHVVDPNGGEAWSDKPNTYEPPGPGEPPVDPNTYLIGGRLDRDANHSCRRDGRPREQVIWTIELRADGMTPIFAMDVPPPPGTYTVRVDARSMCGDASAPWHAAAYRDGQLITAARGVALPDDVLQPHGAGAGVLAFRFEL